MSAWTFTHRDFHIIKDLLYLIFFPPKIYRHTPIHAYSGHLRYPVGLCLFTSHPWRSFLFLSQVISSCLSPSPYLRVCWGHRCEWFSPGGSIARRVEVFHFFVHTLNRVQYLPFDVSYWVENVLLAASRTTQLYLMDQEMQLEVWTHSLCSQPPVELPGVVTWQKQNTAHRSFNTHLSVHPVQLCLHSVGSGLVAGCCSPLPLIAAYLQTGPWVEELSQASLWFKQKGHGQWSLHLCSPYNWVDCLLGSFSINE